MAISFVRACQDYFSADPFGRRVQIAEFKALTEQDKIELSQAMTEAGIEHTPYVPPATKE